MCIGYCNTCAGGIVCGVRAPKARLRACALARACVYLCGRGEQCRVIPQNRHVHTCSRLFGDPMLPPAALFLALAPPSRPPVAQQITWLYSTSLSKGAHFLSSLGFAEVNGTKQAKLCRIFNTAPSHFLGVCNSRPAAQCPEGPEGAQVPPVTYTLVVPTIREVNEWHAHLSTVGAATVTTNTPSHSAQFGCYAFNFYDTDRVNGLGCYRFEVQSFEDPAWPAPQCPPISSPLALPSPPPPPPRPSAPPNRVVLDLFVASKCPDAPKCERMLEPVLQAVGELVDVRLGFVGDGHGSSTRCLHGPTECVANRAQLCTHRYWPYHVDVETHRLPAHLNWMLFVHCVSDAGDGSGRPFNHTSTARNPGNTNACLQRYAVPSATADAIDACVHGEEGSALLDASINRTLSMCGPHSDQPGQACKSCTSTRARVKLESMPP